MHIGDPSVIGIADLSRPDYGEAVSLREGELPVFWACGVTPQNVILESRSGCLTMTSRREHLASFASVVMLDGGAARPDRH